MTQRDDEAGRTSPAEMAKSGRSWWDLADVTVLVTLRHGVRTQWNNASLVKHCISSGQRFYSCRAEDKIGSQKTKPTLHQRVIIGGMKVKQTAMLESDVDLAVGMKAMVMLNISTDAELANGTQEIIEDIMLDA